MSDVQVVQADATALQGKRLLPTSCLCVLIKRRYGGGGGRGEGGKDKA